MNVKTSYRWLLLLLICGATVPLLVGATPKSTEPFREVTLAQLAKGGVKISPAASGATAISLDRADARARGLWGAAEHVSSQETVLANVSFPDDPLMKGCRCWVVVSQPPGPVVPALAPGDAGQVIQVDYDLLVLDAQTGEPVFSERLAMP